MKRILLLLLLLGTSGLLAAQPRVATRESSDRKSIDFVLEGKELPGTVTVLMNFSTLKNCTNTTGLHKFQVRYDNMNFLTLRRSDDTKGIAYNYTYRVIKSPLDPKFDSAFVYRMPCSAGKPVRVGRTISANDHYLKSNANPEELGVFFVLEKGDTVCAMRRGLVTEVRRTERKMPDSGLEYTSDVAYILVEQPDGTVARYANIDSDNILVEPGDQVWPSTPLALAGTVNGKDYLAAVLIYWYATNMAPGASWDNDFIILRHYSPRFATSEGVVSPEHGAYCTPVMTQEMMTREMTKKELKQRGKSGK